MAYICSYSEFVLKPFDPQYFGHWIFIQSYCVNTCVLNMYSLKDHQLNVLLLYPQSCLASVCLKMFCTCIHSRTNLSFKSNYYSMGGY